MPMTICYFGTYNTKAARNQILIKGLRENGASVIECNSERPGPVKYLDLVRMHWRLRGTYDVMIVGFPGYKAVLLAKLLTRKPVVFDAFVSLYDSIVFDRQLIHAKSPKALYYWLTDWLSCRAADLILLDTNTHIEYFVEEFALPRDKFRRVLIGANEEIFYPMERVSHGGRFIAQFHGSFIPLQGIQYILDAAKELAGEAIQFVIVGDGQTYRQMIAYAAELNLQNVMFVGKKSYEEMNRYINESDITLGIFGDTPKARRVIPNKVYEALAAKAVVITGDSPATREMFKDGEHLRLCNMADGADLAGKILELRDNGVLRTRLAEGGLRRFFEVGTPKKIAAKLINDLRAASLIS